MHTLTHRKPTGKRARVKRNDKIIGVKVPGMLLAAVEYEAERRGLSVSAIVRETLMARFEGLNLASLAKGGSHVSA